MANRLQLQSKLEKLLGTKNVYYQPPESIKLQYTAIVYSKNRLDGTHANDYMYLKNTRYEVIVISRLPDDPVIDKLLELPYCSYDRNYVSGNLHHDVFTIYF